MFMNQTDDPIFSSHKRTIQTFEAGAVEFYLADDPVTPVACVQQVSRYAWYWKATNESLSISSALHRPVETYALR